MSWNAKSVAREMNRVLICTSRSRMSMSSTVVTSSPHSPCPGNPQASSTTHLMIHPAIGSPSLPGPVDGVV